VALASTLLFVVAWGLAIGAGGRWLLPGPDPMPAWLTLAIGLGGSLVGAGAVVAVGGLPQTAGEAYGLVWATIGASLLAALLLVAVYRRVVQRRPVRGRGAHRLPTRGIGVQRLRERLGVPHPGHDAEGAGGDPAVRLRRLAELRESGLITDEELAALRAHLTPAA
jgi:uncharacterized membrane protein YeaQ/YmgE (transglycosylase-associated protein family)